MENLQRQSPEVFLEEKFEPDGEEGKNQD
jgi:hypothetical protein